jgi:8-oxo-dGTP diphosphatase
VTAVRVVAAVIERDGKYLACRRAEHKSLAGLWEFPGGKVEPGETDQHALRREILEELGVEISVGEYLATSLNKAGDLDIELVAYVAQLADGDVTASSDHDELRWLMANELESVEWAPADVPFLQIVAALR